MHETMQLYKCEDSFERDSLNSVISDSGISSSESCKYLSSKQIGKFILFFKMILFLFE